MPTQKSHRLNPSLPLSAEQKICTWCKKPITTFKDSISHREYTISGMCQICQDATFG